MRVGFDITPLVRPFPPGVVRAVRGTLDALEARGNLEVVRLEIPGRRILGGGAAPPGLAGLHSFTSAFPWRFRGPRVQTIHEAPWRHGVAENAGLAHRAWAFLGPLLADRVLCPTAHVRDNLAIPRWRGGDRLRVVPWGVGPPFGPAALPGDGDAEVVAACAPGVVEPFVLALGATRPKKGLLSLLEGIDARRLRGESVPALLVTGPPTPELERVQKFAKARRLAERFHHVERLPEEALPCVLRRAAAVAVLSRSEGFGFPALEALACGTPALVRPASAPAEVAGEAGIIVDPEVPDSVAAGIGRALDEGESRRAAGVARAAVYSWDATAERIEAVWGELA